MQKNILKHLKIEKLIKNTKGMDFERYASKILSLGNIYDQSNDISKNENKVRQSRFQIKNTKMIMTSSIKSHFYFFHRRKILFS